MAYREPSEMVRRCAIALAASEGKTYGKDGARAFWDAGAEAVIRAMETPTERMLDKVERDPTLMARRAYADCIYQTMIDEALRA